MEKELLQVAAFMRLFHQTVHFSPTELISVKDYELRKKLTHEESREFFEDGFTTNTPIKDDLVINLATALDGLADRLYVLLGDAHTIGMGLILPTAFRMVHESNMTKLWTEEEVEWANQTDTNLKFEKVIKTTDRKERAYIARNAIDKVMKSPSYEKVDWYAFFDDIQGQGVLDFKQTKALVFGDAPEPDIEELYLQVTKDDDDEQD